MKIPQTPEEHLGLMKKILAGVATPEEIALAKNPQAIQGGVIEEPVTGQAPPAWPKTAASPGAIRDAELRARQYIGTDIDSGQVNNEEDKN